MKDGMTKILKEYEGLSKKVGNLSTLRSDETAEQMHRAEAQMVGMKKALLCLGYDIGRARDGNFAIRRLPVYKR